MGTERDPARSAVPAPPAASSGAMELPTDRASVQALQEAVGLIASGDVGPLAQALTTVSGLLRSGGPLAHLRFDAERFAQVVEPQLRRFAEAQPMEGNAEDEEAMEERRHALWRSCVTGLETEPLARALRQALLERARRRATPASERMPLLLGVLLLGGLPGYEPPPAGEHPLLENLFFAQLDEWMGRQERLEETVEALLGPRPEDGFSPAAVEAALSADPEHVTRLLASDPALARELQATAERVSEEVLGSLSEVEHPVLGGPEAILLQGLLAPVERALLKREEPGPELKRLLEEHMTAELVEAVVERLGRKAKDASLPAEARTWYQGARLVADLKPVPFIIAALFTARHVDARSPEEEALLERLLDEEAWSAETLEPYRQYLLASQDARGAAWIAKLQAYATERGGSLDVS
jgi:hypothetical protein